MVMLIAHILLHSHTGKMHSACTISSNVSKLYCEPLFPAAKLQFKVDVNVTFNLCLLSQYAFWTPRLFFINCWHSFVTNKTKVTMALFSKIVFCNRTPLRCLSLFHQLSVCLVQKVPVCLLVSLLVHSIWNGSNV